MALLMYSFSIFHVDTVIRIWSTVTWLRNLVWRSIQGLRPTRWQKFLQTQHNKIKRLGSSSRLSVWEEPAHVEEASLSIFGIHFPLFIFIQIFRISTDSDRPFIKVYWLNWDSIIFIESLNLSLNSYLDESIEPIHLLFLWMHLWNEYLFVEDILKIFKGFIYTADWKDSNSLYSSLINWSLDILLKPFL